MHFWTPTLLNGGNENVSEQVEEATTPMLKAKPTKMTPTKAMQNATGTMIRIQPSGTSTFIYNTWKARNIK
jgi:hypothetical protein